MTEDVPPRMNSVDISFAPSAVLNKGSLDVPAAYKKCCVHIKITHTMFIFGVRYKYCPDVGPNVSDTLCSNFVHGTNIRAMEWIANVCMHGNNFKHLHIHCFGIFYVSDVARYAALL